MKLLINPFVFIFQSIKPKEFRWIGYALAGAAAVGSVIGSNKAAKENAKLVKENLVMNQMQTAEDLRKMELSFQQVKGEATARAAASGFVLNDQRKNYFDQLNSEYQNQVNWTMKSSDQRAKQIRRGGAYQDSAISNTRDQGLLSAASLAMSWYK